MGLDKSQILEAKDREYDKVECPEWGGEVRIQSLSLQERDEFHEFLMDFEMDAQGQPVAKNIRQKDSNAILCTLGIVDVDGERMFSREEYKDLRERSAKVIDRIANRIREISDMMEEEQVKKNSNSSQRNGSSSD